MPLYDYTAYPNDQSAHAIYGEVSAESDGLAKDKIRTQCPHCDRIELSIIAPDPGAQAAEQPSPCCDPLTPADDA